DGIEESLSRDQLTMLARYKESEIGDSDITAIRCNLYERVIYRCVIGSQAYGLAGEGSDIDRRGIYLPPADLHWSLYGVPGEVEARYAPDSTAALGHQHHAGRLRAGQGRGASRKTAGDPAGRDALGRSRGLAEAPASRIQRRLGSDEVAGTPGLRAGQCVSDR